jgi:hypothetical protein
MKIDSLLEGGLDEKDSSPRGVADEGNTTGQQLRLDVSRSPS